MISGNKYEHCLEQFTIDEREIVTKYLEQIEYYGNDEYINRCIYAIICCIIKKIVHSEINIVKENSEILLMMIDVKNIIKNFIIMHEELLPILIQYFPNCDMYAESSLLFCNNYAFGLMERLRKNRNIVLRELKLKKIENERR